MVDANEIQQSSICGVGGKSREIQQPQAALLTVRRHAVKRLNHLISAENLVGQSFCGRYHSISALQVN